MRRSGRHRREWITFIRIKRHREWLGPSCHARTPFCLGVQGTSTGQLPFGFGTASCALRCVRGRSHLRLYQRTPVAPPFAGTERSGTLLLGPLCTGCRGLVLARLTSFSWSCRLLFKHTGGATFAKLSVS